MQNKKDLWNDLPYQTKLNWLKSQKSLYPTKGDIFNMAEVYANTPYHLLTGEVHRLFDKCTLFD